jgi:hypothetical protein
MKITFNSNVLWVLPASYVVMIALGDLHGMYHVILAPGLWTCTFGLAALLIVAAGALRTIIWSLRGHRKAAITADQ